MTTPKDTDDVKPGPPSDGVATVARNVYLSGDRDKGIKATGRPPIVGEIDKGGPEPKKNALWGTIRTERRTSDDWADEVDVMLQSGRIVTAKHFDPRTDLFIGRTVPLFETRDPREETGPMSEEDKQDLGLTRYFIPHLELPALKFGLATITGSAADPVSPDASGVAYKEIDGDVIVLYRSISAKEELPIAATLYVPNLGTAAEPEYWELVTDTQVIVQEWSQDRWMIIGIFAEGSKQSMHFVGTLDAAITDAGGTVDVSVTATDHPQIEVSDTVEVTNLTKKTANLGANVICVANNDLTFKYIVDVECPPAP